LLRQFAGAAVKARGPGRGQQGVAAGRHGEVDAEHIATHDATGWVHQHVVADRVALGVEALQHAQGAVVQVVRNGALFIQTVVQGQVPVPTHA